MHQCRRRGNGDDDDNDDDDDDDEGSNDDYDDLFSFKIMFSVMFRTKLYRDASDRPGLNPSLTLSLKTRPSRPTVHPWA